MKKPTLEDQELLVDLLLNSDSVRVFVDELERHAISAEQDLVKLSLLDSEEDVRKLVRLKHEAHGARKLFTNFRARLEQIRLAALKAASKNPTDD